LRGVALPLFGKRTWISLVIAFAKLAGTNYSAEEREELLNLMTVMPAMADAGESLEGLAAASYVPSSCSIELLMVDDRALDFHSYWTKTLAINYLVAKRYNWSFTLVRPTKQADLSVMWCKIPAMEEAVQDALRRHASRSSNGHPCTWLMYIDADAFIRDAGVDLARKLAGLAERAGAEMVIAREDGGSERNGVLTDAGEPFAVADPAVVLNDGIFMVRASAWTSRFLRVWFGWRNHPKCAGHGDNNFRTHWPGEQACLEMLIESLNEKLPRTPRDGHDDEKVEGHEPLDPRKVLTAPMTLFNSPWGRYVTHAWGGRGGREKFAAMDHELRTVYRIFNLSSFVRDNLDNSPSPHGQKHRSKGSRFVEREMRSECASK
jgi:hypothetical protein